LFHVLYHDYVVITPQEVGLVVPACRRCGSTGKPLPQLTLAFQYSNKDSYSTKICLKTLQKVIIPTQLMEQCTHTYMEVCLQPDPIGNTKQSTEEVLLNESLVDQDSSDTNEQLKCLLPLTFSKSPVYRDIPRNKMDGISVSFTLCLRKDSTSAMAVASTNVPLNSAIKMVMPHTLHLLHTSQFLSHWRPSPSHVHQ